jgi:hypothetical protein
MDKTLIPVQPVTSNGSSAPTEQLKIVIVGHVDHGKSMTGVGASLQQFLAIVGFGTARAGGALENAVARDPNQIRRDCTLRRIVSLMLLQDR